MLRRLHTRIIGMGSICGLTPSPPAEVFLKTLPPPNEIDPAKYTRFQREEEESSKTAVTSSTASTSRMPEPFYRLVTGAAGHRHIALLTQEGNLITIGDNRYGQTASYGKEEDATQVPGSAGGSSGHNRPGEHAPLYIDLDGAFASPPNETTTAQVACGSNFTVVYMRGGRRAVAFGNNHVGQLGVGHKSHVTGGRGFCEWDPTAAWWPSAGRSTIDSVTCGFNHSVVQLSCGSLFGFGSNTWGELANGTTTSPMHPTAIPYFANKGVKVRKVAAGNSFTLFLTEEGRVYGCGATNYGQLPSNTFEPVAVPLVRSFQKGGEKGTKPLPGKQLQRLVRVRDIACVGSLAVYLSSKNELLVQGSLPEFGVSVPSPRFVAVDQSNAVRALSAGMGVAVDAEQRTQEVLDDGFVIEELIPGPSTLLVRYRNGCVAALGTNTEGQLHNVTKVLNGKGINLAPTYAATELLPVLAPAPGCQSAWRDGRTWFVSGRGFNLLFDNDEMYPVLEENKPIEMPPAQKLPRSVAAPKPSQKRNAVDRQEVLRKVLK